MSIVFVDDFNRENTTASPTGLRVFSGDPSVVWEALRGNWGISNNRAVTTLGRSSNPLAVVEVGISDVDVQADVSTGGGDCLYFRVADADNWWRVRISAHTYQSGTNYSPGPWVLQSTTSGHSTCGTTYGSYLHGYATTMSVCVSQDATSGRYFWDNYTRTITGTPTYSTSRQIVLDRCVGGVTTLAVRTYSHASGKLRVYADGSVITLYRWVGGGTPWAAMGSVEDSSPLMTATKHGIGRGTSVDNGHLIDNFRLELLVPLVPYAPIPDAPANDLKINRKTGQVFQWQFSSQGSDYQTAYQLQVRPAGTAGDDWLYEVSNTTTVTSHTFPASTFAVGEWEWRVRTLGRGGQAFSPWSAPATFEAIEPPLAPLLSDPLANGATIGQSDVVVEWALEPLQQQGAYQIQILSDVANEPGGIRFDTGVIESTSARSHLVEFPTNNISEHLRIRVRYQGLWSEWTIVRVSVSYTPPAIPSVSLIENSTAGTITVVVEFQEPAPGEPPVVDWDVFVRVLPGGRDDLERLADGSDGIRLAAHLPETQTVFIDRAPASGVQYQYRVLVRGNDDTSAIGEWVG